MIILVTGAMGHLGYEIARQAVAQGHGVVAIYRDELRDADAAALGPKVKWLSCELTDAAAVNNLVRQHEIDTCIHAAAISNEAYARPNPIDAIASNVGATANLLDAARVAKWRRFVFVSTGSVFQKRTDTVGPILEDATPQPANIYSTTKFSAELLTRMYRSEFGLSASTVRISWVFGPPVVSESPARGPIPSYLLRAVRGETISEGWRRLRGELHVHRRCSGGVARGSVGARIAL